MMKINNLVTNALVKNTLVAKFLVNKPLVSRGIVTKALVKYSLLTLSCLFVLGCAQQPEYILATSNQQIKQVQILDPNAPERNDGIIATLDGNYGKNVVRKYQRSIYDMKDSRQMKQNSQ